MEKLKFAVEDIKLIEERNESQFATVKIDAFASGVNRHNLDVSVDTLKRTATTLYNKPLIWEFDPIFNDVGTHSKKTSPAGFVVPDSAEFRELEDGRTMMSVLGKIWRKYSGNLLDIFKRDEDKKGVSVEMDVYEVNEEDDDNKPSSLLDYAYTAICILGDLITPAIPGAEMSALNFSSEYQEAYQQEFASQGDAVVEREGDQKGKEEDEEVNRKIAEQKFSLNSSQITEILSNAFDGYKYQSGDWECRKYYVESFDGEFVFVYDNEDGKVYRFGYVIDNKVATVDMESKAEVIRGGYELVGAQSDPMNMAAEGEGTQKPEGDEGKEPGEGQATMSSEENFDVAAILSMFEDEPENKDIVAGEFAKEVSERDYAKVCASLFAKMCKMAESCKQMAAEKEDACNKMAQMSADAEKKEAEFSALKEFKTKIETDQFNFAVDATLKDVEEHMPKDELDKMREDATNFSLETVDAWKNKVKALAFTYTKGKKNDDGITRMAMPWSNGKTQKKSIWDD